MKALLRADAGVMTGTGHVMRCLTLAEELRTRGHEVTLRGNLGGISWLTDRMAASGIRSEPAQPGLLDVSSEEARAFDLVVVDSYEIDPRAISSLNERAPVLAIIDEHDRGIGASLYLDQNLGADERSWNDRVADRLLAGSRFSLVRAEVRDRRRSRTRALADPPTVVAFMGGSDPLGAIRPIAERLTDLDPDVHLQLVVAAPWETEVRRASEKRTDVEIIPPTPKLIELLADADVVISATGTSAWDVCTLGIPAVFVAVVENQIAGLREIVARRLALGIDVSGTSVDVRALTGMVESLLHDDALRDSLHRRTSELFDGRGAERVCVAAESLIGRR